MKTRNLGKLSNVWDILNVQLPNKKHNEELGRLRQEMRGDEDRDNIKTPGGR